MSYAEEDYGGFDIDFYGIDPSPKELRIERMWVTKDGRKIKVTEMDDKHLFNAYMMTGAEFLKDEMLFRLFEERIK